jgi:hypothetical protein
MNLTCSSGKRLRSFMLLPWLINPCHSIVVCATEIWMTT